MKPVKFIHMADLHIDTPFTSLSYIEGEALKRRFEQRTALNKIIQAAKEEEVDFILISGDLFEHEYVTEGSITFINECFSSIPDIRIFISPGNHDPYVRNSYYSTYKWAPNVYIFKDTLEEVYLEDLKTSIYGVGFNDFFVYESKIKNIKLSKPEAINILLTHGTVDSLGGAEGYHTVSSSVIEKAGFDYAAFGHIHKYIPGLAGEKAYYPGSAVALGFDEPGNHGIIIGTVNEKKRSIRFLPIDNKEYITLDIDVGDCSSASEVLIKTVDKCREFANGKNYCRIILCGQANALIIDEIEIVKKHLEEEFKGCIAGIGLNLEARYVLEDIIKGNDLRAVFARKIKSMIDNEQDEKEKQRLAKVLHLGLTAVEGKKVKFF